MFKINKHQALLAFVIGFIIEIVQILYANFKSCQTDVCDFQMGFPFSISRIHKSALSSILEGSPAPTLSQTIIAWLTFILDLAIFAVVIYLIFVFLRKRSLRS